MDAPFADVSLNSDAALYIARGLRALAAVDGVHAAELALIEQYEASLGLDGPALGDFESAGGGPLVEAAQRELFLRSLVLLALADGSISDPEDQMIRAVAADLGLSDDNLTGITVEAKQWLLGSLRGVQAFREQAVRVGKGLGLSDAQIEAALADDA